MSDRAFGKAIRRLVTRNYLSMDLDGAYRLTPEGIKAAKIIARVDELNPRARKAAGEAEDTVSRRLTVVVPRLLGVGSPAQLYAGIEAPDARQHLNGATSVVLRVEGINCSVSPVEHTLSVPQNAAAQPAAFTVIPDGIGQGRVRMRAYQLLRSDEVREVGGMYFDFLVDDTPSTALQAVGIDLDLYI
ncbi:MAG: hypothetical protein JXB47_21250 [Anaerolineae bacterium]|nr:hypothetical protein [Anaerolineae bacterium]